MSGKVLGVARVVLIVSIPMSLSSSMVVGGGSSAAILLAQWRSTVPYTRAAARVVAGAIAFGLVLFALGQSGHRPSLELFGSTFMWRATMLALPLAPAIVLSRLVWIWTVPKKEAPREDATEKDTRMEDAVKAVPPAKAPSPRLSRRSVIQASALSLPAAAGVFGIGGQLGALDAARLRSISMGGPHRSGVRAPLRIAQLSDLHLGIEKSVKDVAAIAEQLSQQALDLLVITGDVADHLHELAPALALLDRVPTRLGRFAVLGNHDHFHDVRFVRKKFDASAFHLLTNAHAIVKDGDEALTMVGIDDPIALGHGDPFFRDARFFRTVLDYSLRSAPSQGRRIVLSHRPEALDVPIAGSIILSGHTHGGQLGLFGHPVAQHLSPQRFPYPWGVYEKYGSSLYTTSGFGHWFPFRFGCRAETPIITLT